MRNTVVALFLSLTFALAFVLRAEAYYLVGVIDRDGNSVVPCRYGRIRYLCNGLFYAGKINRARPKDISYEGDLLDKNGKVVPVKLPPGCTLADVCLPAQLSPADSNESKLPDGTILEIHSPSGLGLCNLDGQTILEPKYVSIDGPNNGIFIVYKSRYSGPFAPALCLFDSTSRRTIAVPKNNVKVLGWGNVPLWQYEICDVKDPQSEYLWGLIDRHGKVVLAPQCSWIQPWSKEGIAAACCPGRTPTQTYIDRNGKLAVQSYEKAGEFCDGKAIVTVKSGSKMLKGLINTAYDFVLEPIYRELDKGPASLYIAKSEDAEHFELITERGQIVHQFSDDIVQVKKLSDSLLLSKTASSYQAVHLDGSLAFSFPEGGVPVGIFEDGLIKCAVPAELSTDRKIAFIDESGKTRFKAAAKRAFPCEFGFVCLWQEPTDKPYLWELRDITGRVVEPPITGYYGPVTEDRIIKGIEYRHFDKAVWNDKTLYNGVSIERTNQFYYFLDDYNLIGMPRARVLQLLGEPQMKTVPNRWYYHLSGFGCASACGGVEIEFKSEKVFRWRELGGDNWHSENWITTNVVFNPQREPLREPARNLQRFIPKRSHPNPRRTSDSVKGQSARKPSVYR